MFNSTHTFLGLAIARTGADKSVRYATATAVIASNLPDIDILVAPSGTPAYIDFHRGITHSLIGVPILALLLAGAIYSFSGKFWKTYAIALIAMATHPLLDFTNSYGWRPFIPFDATWFYGDILFVFDPYIDLVLLLGIIAGRVSSQLRRAAAWVSLALVVCYIGARIELHHIAAMKFERVIANTPGVENWAVLPDMLNPFLWHGMLETHKEAATVRVHTLGSGIDPAEGDALMDRGARSDAARAAAQTRSATTLLRFARFPVTRVEQSPTGYRVIFLDFRFYSELTKRALASEVLLDKSLHVVKESLSFAQYVD